ncbi:MAG: nucleotidyltransferase domain-containing protein [Candidatus Magasanikbacteria bacterium]|nr:nucleotidyltransferase domain-containing protein [Candidatus Magasanikbacteria bacterium]
MIQNKKKYFERIKKDLSTFAKGKKIQIFLFGSAVRQDKFSDVDVGVKGNITEGDIRKLKEVFETSTLPFKIDVVNFNTAAAAFQKNVLENNKIVWIKR